MWKPRDFVAGKSFKLLGCGVTGKVLVVKMEWRGLVLVVVLGVCIGLISGFFENPPEASVIGHKLWLSVCVGITKTFLAKNICILSCLSIA